MIESPDEETRVLGSSVASTGAAVAAEKDGGEEADNLVLTEGDLVAGERAKGGKGKSVPSVAAEAATTISTTTTAAAAPAQAAKESTTTGAPLDARVL